MKLFFELHSGLSQEAPGSDESTRKALSMIGDLPAEPQILDVGCGPGRQTLVLASETGGRLTAVDTHQPFLDELKVRAARASVADRITTQNCPMAEMKFEPGGFDLIWSEGAIYNMGFREGLESWMRFLKPGGRLAVSEATWLTDSPDAETKAFWNSEYPAMMTIEQNLAVIAEVGYELSGHFTLPESDWLEGYYAPLERRIVGLREKYVGNAEAQAFLDESQNEIDVYRKFSGDYGYTFFVMQKPF